MKYPSYSLLMAAMLLVSACKSKPVVTKPTTEKPAKSVTIPVKPSPEAVLQNLKLPEIKREFRGAWVATVANINWPSRNNLTTSQQKEEAIKLLDFLADLNFNAVVFQVRPAADALYKSMYEPWSPFLTGETGKAPEPFYDPLEFWITEAHRRGMELHVWLNPYRAHHTTSGKITNESMARKMPEEIVRLRNGTYWFDPSNEKTQDHVSKVVKDLVTRYDIDGLHFDDYFYPYREYNGGKDFPDERSWAAYRNTGGTLSRADWRRANVNKFIKRIYDEIKSEKKEVKFGISPFGIWKTGYPADVKGSSQYDELYADAKLWLNEGWVDYFSPQLYWRENGPQRFSSLLKWWQAENTQHRHLWPGLNTVGLKEVPDRPAEIIGQINTTRDIVTANSGEIHYSVAGLTGNPRMAAALKNGPYQEKALVPKSPWLSTETPEKPHLDYTASGNIVTAHWGIKDSEKVSTYILYTKYGDKWETMILPKLQNALSLPRNKAGEKLHTIVVKAVDRAGNESPYNARLIL